jgi:hypothetical protein
MAKAAKKEIEKMAKSPAKKKSAPEPVVEQQDAVA